MLAACSNQSSNHFNNTLTSHPFPNISSAMLQVGLTFLRGQDSEWNTAQGKRPSDIIKKDPHFLLGFHVDTEYQCNQLDLVHALEIEIRIIH